MRGMTQMGLWIVCAVGCTNKGDDVTILPPDITETGQTTPTGDTGPIAIDGDLVVLPEHNYALTVDWTVSVSEARARWDLLFAWDDLTIDAWGQPIDPASIEQIVLVELLYPPDEVAEHLEADDFGTNLLSVWSADVAGTVFASASDLVNGSTPFNPQGFLAEEPGKTWLLGAARTVGDRIDLRALRALQIVDNATVVSAELDDTSSAVSYAAAASATHLSVSPGADLYTIDWDSLPLDALGKPYDDNLGNELFIGRFDAGIDLSSEILALSDVASAWWTMDVERETDARLDLARDAQGGVFPGFTEGPVWLVGVRCTTCLSPFPLWIAAIDVAAP